MSDNPSAVSLMIKAILDYFRSPTVQSGSTVKTPYESPAHKMARESEEDAKR